MATVHNPSLVDGADLPGYGIVIGPDETITIDDDQAVDMFGDPPEHPTLTVALATPRPAAPAAPAAPPAAEPAPVTDPATTDQEKTQ